jgi:hypothetical protein
VVLVNRMCGLSESIASACASREDAGEVIEVPTNSVATTGERGSSKCRRAAAAPSRGG